MITKNLLIKKPFSRLTKFIVTGVGATVIHVIIASALISGLGTNTQFGNGAAFVLATTFSYTINTVWSFSNVMGRRNAFRFIIASLVGLGLTALISLVADMLGLHYLFGVAMVVTTVPIYTFLVHSRWTYR